MMLIFVFLYLIRNGWILRLCVYVCLFACYRGREFYIEHNNSRGDRDVLLLSTVCRLFFIAITDVFKLSNYYPKSPKKVHLSERLLLPPPPTVLVFLLSLTHTHKHQSRALSRVLPLVLTIIFHCPVIIVVVQWPQAFFQILSPPPPLPLPGTKL